jgi:hypothetical protein
MMNIGSKAGYLDFQNIWHRKKLLNFLMNLNRGYDAHIRRLKEVKGSNY